MPLQYPAGDTIVRSEQQLISPNLNQQYAIDPSLQTHAAQAQGMRVKHSYTGNNDAMRQLMNHNHSFDGQGQQLVMTFNDEQTQDDAGAGAGETRKKKGSASSIANDNELRKLFAANKDRDLDDVAASVLANERGPKSEKTKQIFAMNWLNSICRRGNSSVPRNRVYTLYATRCGNQRVSPLNPASFGKLVRIIFPGIQTRRLGMRGESKYHYVDLTLVEDHPEGHGGEQFQSGGDVVEATNSSNARSFRTQLPADTAVFPSPNKKFTLDPSHNSMHNQRAPGCLYLNPASPNIHRGPSRRNMIIRELKFPTQQEPPYAHNEPIELPSLQPYLPTGTDPDAANALIALYRTHCISVIDSFRFCKEKMFWHHFTSFHGTLTVPVQKLLAHSNIASWIQECDWLMYQKMIRFVSPLALQVMPPKVTETFRNISNKLNSHISTTFQNHPQHVRDAKLGPATIFAGLIDRLLRVNATAHAAANMLTNDANRDQMWHDWVYYVKPVSVVESSLPGQGYTRTLQILTNEIRELLGPLSAASYPGMQPIYAKAASSVGLNYLQQSQHEMDDSSTSGVLDRWTTFLYDLSSRFPGVDARLLLHCVGDVGSAALRDITMAQALSFGSWWVTKVWVDEMLQWMAEKGGFLEHSPISMEIRPQKRSAYDAGFGVNDNETETRGGSRPRTGVSDSVDARSRYGSVDMGTNSHGEHGQLDLHLQHYRYNDPAPTATMDGSAQEHFDEPIPQHVNKEAKFELRQSHDDSGIGMDVVELPEHGESRGGADYGGFVASGVNGASDPADVVVC